MKEEENDFINDELKIAIKEIPSLLATEIALSYKLQLLEHLLGMTASEAGLQVLSTSHELVQALKTVVLNEEEHAYPRTDSLCILMNTTATKEATGSKQNALSILLHDDMLTFLFGQVLDRESLMADASSALLNNMSRTEDNCRMILDNIRMSESVTFPKLVESFTIEKFNEKVGALHHVGSFLANMTILRVPRTFILDKDRCVIQRILPYLTYKESAGRRQSAIRIVRNCVYHESEYHEWLLGEDIDILPALLLPLTGPEEYVDDEMDQLPLDLQFLPADKKREPNMDSCLLLIESLYQMCALKTPRKMIKDSGAYFILRELDKSEHLKKSPEASAMLIKMIYLLIGDEPTIGDNLKDIEVPQEMAQKFNEDDKQDVEDMRQQLEQGKLSEHEKTQEPTNNNMIYMG